MTVDEIAQAFPPILIFRLFANLKCETALITAYTAVAMYDLPVLLGPTKIVRGFRSNDPSAMGPKFLTEIVSIGALSG